MRPTPYHRCISGRSALATRALSAAAGLLPVAVAAGWVPLRDRLPNTDVALVLVVVVAAVGLLAGRLAAVVGSIGAGAAFDLLHTRPYGHLAITHGRDILTTSLLVTAALTAGLVAAGATRYRRAAESDADALALVSDAAGLVATGGDPRLVIEALAGELLSGLELADCRFEPSPPHGSLPVIERDGVIRPAPGVPAGAGTGAGVAVLPVWVAGEVRAHFLLDTGAGPSPTAAQCRLAVSIADQAGAALQAGPVGPTPRRLRLVRSR
ncbi:MAG: DUF4118 domain-containing protein [Gemmatimonadales bacterium]